MFGLSFLHPLFLAGAVLVGAPILIHLLNKRRFRILDWAAMDFLLEADRKNRRRIQLEELLLLLLRCLAVLLLALLVARPLLRPTGLAGAILPSSPMERIILLDDSPSMTAVVNGRSLFEQAVAGVRDFVREVARQRSADRLTILLTSRPHQPLVAGVGTDQLSNILQTLETLKPSDLPAQMDLALTALDQQFQSAQGLPNRSLYLVTDLRKRDWAVPAAQDNVPASRSVPGMLATLAGKTQALVVVDVGEGIETNLAVSELTSLEKTLVAGVESRFQAVVSNTGQADVDDVEVAFKAGDAPEQRVRIPAIKAGDRATASFTAILRQAGSLPITAQLGPDALAADNIRYLGAPVQPGIQVLLVDGEPAGQRGQGQAFYLRHALGPAGEAASGNLVEVVADSVFESMPLDRYQIVFLCNVYRLSAARIESLQNWVKAGGGLVFFLGEQCDAMLYNDLLYQEGKGLLPAKLMTVAGDPQRRDAVRLTIDKANHPLLTVFEGSQNPFVQSVKIFRWWNLVPPPAAATSPAAAQTLAGLTDSAGSPALLQKPYGAGQVLAFAFPADDDWSNWPSDPSFVITALEMVRYAGRPFKDQSSLAVGAPIRYELDPQRHRIEARLLRPDQESLTVTAVEMPDQPGRMIMQYPATEAAVSRLSETARAGFYELELARLDGPSDVIRFAANIDPTESQLEGADQAALRKLWEGTPIQMVRGKASLGLAATGIGRDLWVWLLATVALLLGLEQFLAWTFGRKR